MAFVMESSCYTDQEKGQGPEVGFGARKQNAVITVSNSLNFKLYSAKKFSDPLEQGKGLHLLHTMLPIQAFSHSKTEVAGHKLHWELNPLSAIEDKLRERTAARSQSRCGPSNHCGHWCLLQAELALWGRKARCQVACQSAEATLTHSGLDRERS